MPMPDLSAFARAMANVMTDRQRYAIEQGAVDHANSDDPTGAWAVLYETARYAEMWTQPRDAGTDREAQR